MHIRWINCQEKAVLFLSQKNLENFKIESEKVTFHLGSWKEMLNIKIHKELNEDTIGLPNHLNDIFTIPDTLPYDMYLDGEDLYLGPVIAFCVRAGHLLLKRRDKWADYCQNYSEIRGLVYFYTVSEMDMSTKRIRGYYYDPNAGETEQLKFGIFPYPGVVYRRAAINPDILHNLNKQVDGKIFNARIIDKWKMWTVLSKAGFIHTPHTIRLNDVDSLKKMFDLYNSVYLKPVRGSFGNGIQKIEKTMAGYLFKEKSGIEQCVEDLAQIFELIEKYKKKRKYIIQQAVPLNFQEKPVDFRVILQKDRSQEWKCSGIIAKIGLKGRIHTNNISSIELVREALQTIFKLSPEQSLEKENEITRVCTEACLLVEHAYGYFGDVGIDVVVDQNLNIWILEINTFHQHKMARYQRDDPDMYNRVVSRPLEYAKALAGFK